MKLRTTLFGVLSLLVALIPSASVLAAPADLDLNYNQAVLRPHIAELNVSGGFETFQVGKGFDGSVYAILRQSDGKLVVGGDFTSFNGVSRNGIARLNADGSLDAGFNPGTGFDGRVHALAFLGTDIMVGGVFSTFNGVPRNNIARLRSNGLNEPAFNPGTGFNGGVTALLTANQKGIIVGGDFTSYNGVARNHIANIGQGGNLQLGFNPGTGLDNGLIMNAQVNALAPSAGGILIGGLFTSYNGVSFNNIVRVTTTGTIDQSFHPGTGFNERVRAFAMSGTDIVVGGYFTSYQGVSRYYVSRLHADGSLDQGFDPGFNGPNTVVHALAIDAGDIYIGGAFDYASGLQRHRIARLNADGSLDALFDTSAGPNDDVYAVVVADLGKIVIGGAFVTDFSTGFNDRVTSMVRQPDGKMVVGGYFTSYRGISCNHIARLNPNGSFDSTFFMAGGFNGPVNALALDGTDIVVGGQFSVYNGTLRNNIARLNTDGSLDTNFDPGSGFDSGVTALAVSGADVYAGGYFSTFNGVSRHNIARLNTDGTLDDAFKPGSGFNASVMTLAAYGADVFAGGYFTEYNGVSIGHIARLNDDGTRDIAFNPGAGFNSAVHTLAIDGANVFVGGDFNTYDGLESHYVAHLTDTGAFDNNFKTSPGLDGSVRAIVVDGANLYVGGHFVLYGGATFTQGIARLHADGALDTTFLPHPGFNIDVYALVKDGASVIVGGDFSTYNGLGTIRLAKLEV